MLERQVVQRGRENIKDTEREREMEVQRVAFVMYAKFINATATLTHLAALAALMLPVPASVMCAQNLQATATTATKLTTATTTTTTAANHSDRATIRESIERQRTSDEAGDKKNQLVSDM